MSDSERLRVSVPDESMRDRLLDGDGLPGHPDAVDLLVWDMTGSPPGDLPVDLAVHPYQQGTAMLADLEPGSVRAIQSQMLGYDNVTEHLPPGITYCNAVGVHEEATAELAVALLLASRRRVDEFARAQLRGEWAAHEHPAVLDSRIVLVGSGGIGAAVRRRLAGFGADVVRVASSARDDEHGHVHGTDELLDLLPGADAVVVGVPLTEATRGLVGTDFLAALDDGTVVVNVSRGPVADTDAVLAEAGRIRYATDVTDPEPLPADHPLWTAPGVLVTPHVGGATPTMHPRVRDLVRGQVRRLLAGEPLRDVVVQG